MNEADVERVARVICQADGHDPEENWGEWKPNIPDPGYVPAWETYADNARAAIAAMPPAWPPMRPMSEAPQDGTRVLAQADGRYIIVSWERHSTHPWTDGDGDFGAWAESVLRGWYPLPPIVREAILGEHAGG